MMSELAEFEKGALLTQSQYIVVVIPGIGGSKLVTPEGEPVWGHSGLNFLHALIRPRSISIDEHPRLIPHGTVDSVRVLPWYFAVHGYNGLVRRLTDPFTNGTSAIAHPDELVAPDANVIEFGYDFRLGVVDAAEKLDDEIRRRLQRLSDTDQDRRVIIVAHSMGGLVARYWLGPLAGARYCRSLITIGTPHRGAPKALDWAVNGPNRFGIEYPRLSKAIEGWQGMYDLLPKAPIVWVEAEGQGHYPADLAERGLLPLHRERTKLAMEMHEDIETAWTDLSGRPPLEAPELTTVSCDGHGTPLYASLDRRGLRTHKRIKNEHRSLPLRDDLHGDGTVPIQSAVPIEEEIEGAERHGSHHAASERHAKMSDSAYAIRTVSRYVNPHPRGYRGEEERKPMLGSEIEQFTLPGQRMTVRSRLLHADPAGVTARAKLTALQDEAAAGDTATGPAEDAKVYDGLMEADGDGWQVELPPLQPGLYELRLSANDKAGAIAVGCTETIVAVEPS